MYRQRKQLIQSLDLLVFILFVYVWFIDGKTLWLLIKSALQVQFCNPIQMHPTWPLPFFAVFLSCFNLIVMLFHLLESSIGSAKARAILIDFIGQEHQTAKVHVLLIDSFTAAIQLVMLVVAYEHGIDELRPDGEKSRLDEDEAVLLGDDCDHVPQGQGWNADDEESTLFAAPVEVGSDAVEAGSERRERVPPNPLSHPIAVVRLDSLARQIWAGDFSPPENGVDADTDTDELRTTGPRPNPDAVSAAAAAFPASVSSSTSRPDTGRLRRFSRRPRPTAMDPNQPTSPSSQTDTPSPLNDDWPPMWLVVARNLVGGESGSFFPAAVSSRFGVGEAWRRWRAGRTERQGTEEAAGRVGRYQRVGERE